MSAEKKSLRKEYIRRRDGISSSLAMIYANAIRARLWNVAEFTEAHAVSGYHSTGSEVYTGEDGFWESLHLEITRWTLSDASSAAYKACDMIQWQNKYCRTDIGRQS